ncbi:isochorismate synthase [Pajaroellobacter abortibovis]|uniref:isochorismate synthase n=1 Tax=Pajaroellobacter abortibovis TaxID=1882918 RepID=A0A1L6MWZ2_9BACT|nr:isochorismate synthase [Pajaroellobacter abortibovis]APR99938.1 hypothetical protein BCY86_04015 [Pajaroellobacter abortibovis]
MLSFEEAGLEEFSHSAAPDQLVSLTWAVEPMEVDHFLEVVKEGTAWLWDPSKEGEGDKWSFAGWGETLRLEVREDLSCEGERILMQAMEKRNPGHLEVPSLRLFGGFAFESDWDPSFPWKKFGCASFSVPRWSYGCCGAKAFLRMTVQGRDCQHRSSLLEEIGGVLKKITTSPFKIENRKLTFRKVEGETLEEWGQKIESILREISLGHFKKVVMACRSRLEAEMPLNGVDIVRRFKGRHGDRVRFLMQRGDFWFVGSTPELLVERREKWIRTDALAGSVVLDVDSRREDCEQRKQELLSSLKDREEHAFVVDWIKASLRPFCHKIDSPDVPFIRELKGLAHLWTPIVAECSQEVHVLELVHALHPTPAVCGIPREIARAWIAAHETSSRGWYAGPIGWFDAKGEGAFFVGIRSMLVHGRTVWVYTGAGILRGSEPEKEYKEIAAKQASLLMSVGDVQK